MDFNELSNDFTGRLCVVLQEELDIPFLCFQTETATPLLGGTHPSVEDERTLLPPLNLPFFFDQRRFRL